MDWRPVLNVTCLSPNGSWARWMENPSKVLCPYARNDLTVEKPLALNAVQWNKKIVRATTRVKR